MPDLPTVTVTTPQAQRCLAAWGSADAYKSWLMAQVRCYVLDAERDAVLAPLQAAQAAAIAALDADDPMEGAT